MDEAATINPFLHAATHGEEREAREESVDPQVATYVTKAGHEHEAHCLGGRTSGGSASEYLFGPRV